MRAPTCCVSRPASLFSRIADSVPQCHFPAGDQTARFSEWERNVIRRDQSAQRQAESLVVLYEPRRPTARKALFPIGSGRGEWHQRCLKSCQIVPFSATFAPARPQSHLSSGLHSPGRLSPEKVRFEPIRNPLRKLAKGATFTGRLASQEFQLNIALCSRVGTSIASHALPIVPKWEAPMRASTERRRRRRLELAVAGEFGPGSVHEDRRSGRHCRRARC